MPDCYSSEAQRTLLNITRQTLLTITSGRGVPEIDLACLPPELVEVRACFVTMRMRFDGSLRGCTGTLVARCPLAIEVAQMTVQTAFYDPRFPPVRAYEVPDIHIEISVLTPPQPLEFTDPDDLLRKLRPGKDGVTLTLDARRATFLPQVWESYPDPRIFLSLLSEKMGCNAEAWRSPRIRVEHYEAIIIEET